jgi:SNF2 family DNA or RNA helicase
MNTLFIPDLVKLDNSPFLETCREYLGKNRLYNLKKEGDSYSAYVLPPKKPLPLKIEITLSSSRIEWNCECGNTSPCLHWWTLLLKLKEQKILTDEDPGPLLLSLVETEKEEEEEPDFEEKPDQKDLFSEPDLFSGLDLFSFSPQDDNDSYEAVFQIYQEVEEDHLLIRPMLRHILSDGIKGGIIRWSREKLTETLGEEQERTIFSMTRSPHPALLVDYLNDLDRMKLCFGTRGITVDLINFDSLLISFKLHNYIPDKGVVFQPLFTIREQGKELTRPLARNKLEIERDSIIHLSENREKLFRFSKNSESSYFIKLLLSRSTGFLEHDLTGLENMARRLKIKSIELDLSGLSTEIVHHDPLPILKIRSRSDRTEIFFYFRYGDQEIPAQMLENYKTVQTKEQILIYQRNRNKEKEHLICLTNILEGELQYERGYYSGYLAGEESEDLRLGLDLPEFISFYGPVLREAGAEIQLENRPITQGGVLSFQLRRESDLLKVNTQVQIDDETAQIMLDKHYKDLGLVRAGNNYIILNEESLEQLEKLKKQGLTEEGELETSLSNIPVLETLSRSTNESDNRELLEENLATLKNLENVKTIVETPLPQRFGTTLRPYQKHGYNWLHFLHNYGLNGCLADDMGLGKTVQTLALLQKLKEEGNLKTSLLITPVVTLPNWEGELLKFTPEIKYIRHWGSNRAEHSDYFKGLDLIIVSYQTIRYDIDLFLEREYDYVILDEGHYIKNASSQTFKAIKQLRSKHRLSLTGTPIENNTSELWSQMTFLNPGLLGTMKEFQERFAIPIERQHDEEAASLLRKTVFPFILRRKKEEVATDLPPREEILHYLDMSSEQEEVYNRQKDFYRALVDGLIEREGLQKASIEIFSYILKMRRLAIHPPMVGEEYHDIPSCKMEAMVNLLDKLQLEDHKVLIFSQFLGTLESLRRLCETRHWPYSHITGETEDRKEEIDRFQHNPGVRIFLLSLKAGGIGINLTAADYVVLFDPWWNPAVEQQAIDRAYRIGQKRKVITYKFITRHTIEEKILAMQEEKKDLADKIITEEQGFVKQLNGREILDLFN